MDKIERRYYSYKNYCIDKYSKKVFKIPISTGASCPNIDGKKGYGGCIYCNTASFVHLDGDKQSIKEQALGSIKRINEKKGLNHFVLYFQDGSNTNLPLEQLKYNINEALVHENIVGIYIGTRADLIDENTLEYFTMLNQKYHVVIELGLQSANNKTLDFINRKHTAEDFIEAVQRINKAKIDIGTHIIFGLPNENFDDYINTVKFIAKLPILMVKLHNLDVVTNTKLADMYKNKEYDVISEDEYIKALAYGISHLRTDQVITRIYGEHTGDNSLLRSSITSRKAPFLHKLDNYMIDNDLFQGKFYTDNK